MPSVKHKKLSDTLPQFCPLDCRTIPHAEKRLSWLAYKVKWLEVQYTTVASIKLHEVNFGLSLLQLSVMYVQAA